MIKFGKKKESTHNGHLVRAGFKDWRVVSAVAIGIGLIIFYFNLFLFQGSPQIFTAVNGVSAVIALGIPIWFRYKTFSRIRKVEQNFPAWVRDVTENIAAGMTLPQAIRQTGKNDYGYLTEYVRDLVAKIDWGISFEKALNSFADSSRSKIIKRTVKGIIEAHRSGGSIATVLDAITVSVQELEKIRKERSVRVYSQLVTGYSIFFLFLGIMLVLSRLLIPTLAQTSQQGNGELQAFYDNIFRALVVIQGIFAGLGVGKMAEGTITAGLKHSFVLAVVGYTAFVII